MDEADEAAVDLLKLILDATKFSLALSVAPLALIVGQLKVLIAIDSCILKVVISLAISCLLVASILGVASITRTRILVAKYTAKPVPKTDPLRGYFKLVERNGNVDADSVIGTVEKTLWVSGISLGLGWLFSITVVFMAIWS